MNEEVFIIAEAGVNHNGSLDTALQMVEIAKESGANAVKFQTFSASKLAAPSLAKAEYQQVNTGKTESQYKMLEELELSAGSFRQIKEKCDDLDICFMSTAFDVDSLKLLKDLGVTIFKIPSGELVNGPLIWEYANLKAPLIVSTGMAHLSDVEFALAVICHGRCNLRPPSSGSEIWQEMTSSGYGRGCEGVTLLHCTTQYPTELVDVNLRAMRTMSDAFGLPIGYSDHTDGFLASTSAVAMGATVIEKHFTIDKSFDGPDHKASMEPTELRAFVANIRATEKMLGSSVKAPTKPEMENAQVIKQKVVALEDINAGDEIRMDMLGTRRATGVGLPPKEIWDLLGRRAARDLRAGRVIQLSDFQ